MIMSKYTLFFNPMSRAMIAKWAFAEAGVEPQTGNGRMGREACCAA